MKRILVCLLALTADAVSQAQDYNTAIGLRVGFSNGITVKHFVKQDQAIEGLLQTRWNGYSLTGLYEFHRRPVRSRNINWYFGAGAHVGLWSGSDADWAEEKSKDYTVFGIDGIVGIEYTFSDTPFNVAFDWKPVYNLLGHTGFWGDGLGLSVRYAF